MELRDYIEAAIEKTGTAVVLAEQLRQNSNAVRDAKRGAKGLPNYACVILAKMLGVPAIEVIAASELVTERREERRAEWLPFVQGATPIQVVLDAIAKAANAPAETKTAPVREPSSDDLVAEHGTEPASVCRARW